MEGVYNKCVDDRIEQHSGREWSHMLIAVSATEDLRDELRQMVHTSPNTNRKLFFLELEYQPCQGHGMLRRL